MQRRSFMKSGAALASVVLAPGLPAVHAASVAVAAGALIMRRIPSSGESIPVIGLGTSGSFEVGTDPEARAPLSEVLGAFLAASASVIDTSPMYSTAEAVLGDLLAPEMQRQVFVATKVWTRGEQEGIAQMKRSMALLGRDKVDLMQVHNLLDLDVQLRTLRRWKEDGRIRYIGVTHFTVDAHTELARVIEREKPDFVQFNYSASTPEAANRLLPLCADLGVATLVNRAFDDGKLLARLKDRPLPAWAGEIDCASWAQLLLKFAIAHPAVTCVIPATGKLGNLEDNLAGGRGRLPDARLRQAILEAVRV